MATTPSQVGCLTLPFPCDSPFLCGSAGSCGSSEPSAALPLPFIENPGYIFLKQSGQKPWLNSTSVCSSI